MWKKLAHMKRENTLTEMIMANDHDPPEDDHITEEHGTTHKMSVGSAMQQPNITPTGSTPPRQHRETGPSRLKQHHKVSPSDPTPKHHPETLVSGQGPTPVVETVIEVTDLVADKAPTSSESNLKKTTSLTVPGSGSLCDERSQSISSTYLSLDHDFTLTEAGGTDTDAPDPPTSLLTEDSFIKSAIPCLPLPAAVFCLVMNVLLPGSGTMASGLSIMCCGKAREESATSATTLCVNVWVGLAQMLTVTYLLVGWFWSLAWGITIVYLAVEHRREEKVQREKELQALALSAFGSTGKGLFGRIGPVT